MCALISVPEPRSTIVSPEVSLRSSIFMADVEPSIRPLWGRSGNLGKFVFSGTFSCGATQAQVDCYTKRVHSSLPEI